MNVWMFACLLLFTALIRDNQATPTAVQCPSGYTDTGGDKCYKIFTSPELKWSDALLACRKEPGIQPDLAAINSEAEQNVIESFGVEKMWIGLSREDNNSPFLWSDGSNVSYTNWAGSGRSPHYHCVLNNYPGFEGDGWNNLYCERTVGYICQTLKKERPVTTPSRCPSGYRDTGDNKCYKLFTSPQLNWSDALLACRNEPGLQPDLATINSPTEQYVIDSFGVYGKWIGLRRKDDYSPFLWSDGSNMSYTNWDDEARTHETSYLLHCVVNNFYRRNGWGNTYCGLTAGYICQTFKAHPNATATSTSTTTTSSQLSTTTTVFTTTSTMPPSTSLMTVIGDLTSGQIAVLVIAVLVVVWLWLTSLVIVLVCRYYDNVALKQQLHQLKLLVASGDKLAQQQQQWQWQEIKA